MPDPTRNPVVRTPRGLVAIFAASRRYINILKAIRKEFPNEKLLSVSAACI